MAAKYSLTIEQGATFYRKLTWKDANNNPIEVTGYKARMQIRKGYGGVLMHSMTSEEGRGITLLPDGIIELDIAADVTSRFNTGSAVYISPAVYDLELEDSIGNVIRLIEGTVTISPEVTI